MLGFYTCKSKMVSAYVRRFVIVQKRKGPPQDYLEGLISGFWVFTSWSLAQLEA